MGHWFDDDDIEDPFEDYPGSPNGPTPDRLKSGDAEPGQLGPSVSQGAAQRKRASSSGSPLSSQSPAKRAASSVADLSAVPASALAGDKYGNGNMGLEV